MGAEGGSRRREEIGEKQQRAWELSEHSGSAEFGNLLTKLRGLENHGVEIWRQALGLALRNSFDSSFCTQG